MRPGTKPLKRDGTVNESKRLQWFLCNFVVKFVWFLNFFHHVKVRRNFAFLKVGSWHSWDNIFHINASSQHEKRPALNFLIFNIKIHAYLFNILFLKKWPTRSDCKNISPEFGNTLKGYVGCVQEFT